MIRVFKCDQAPLVLKSSANYNTTAVREQLRKDQHRKCYVCERRLIVEDQIDHLKNKKEHDELKTEWSNLLLICGYCNGRKGQREIISPLAHNIEELIEQQLSDGTSKVIFTSSSLGVASGIDLDSTIEYLSKLYNSTGRLVDDKAQALYNYTEGELTSFHEIIRAYQEEPSAENRQKVLAQLDVRGELLGFKYWILKSKPELFVEFEGATRWNRCATSGNGTTMPSD